MVESAWVWGTAGAVTAVLALALIARGFSDRLQRSFALFLFLEAMRQCLRMFEDWDGDPGLAALGDMVPYFFIARPFALLYFAAVFHARQSSRRLPHVVGWSILAAAVAMEIWYASTHALVAWNVAGALTEASFPALGILFLMQAKRLPGTARRRALVLAGTAFAFFPLAFTLHFQIPGLMDARNGWPVVEDILTLCAVLVTVVLAWSLARDADPRVAAQARTGLAILAASGASVLILWLLHATLDPATVHPIMVATMSFWYVSALVILTYALMRGTILGLDYRVRVTIGRGFLAGFFVAVFLVTSKLVENYVGAVFGSQWAAGAVVAGLMLFALTPLQRLSERMAGGLMPGATAPSQLDGSRRAQAYREQAEVAWSDGVLGIKERRMLDGARKALALEPSEAQGIEEAVVAALSSGRAAAGLKRQTIVQQG